MTKNVNFNIAIYSVCDLHLAVWQEIQASPSELSDSTTRYTTYITRKPSYC